MTFKVIGKYWYGLQKNCIETPWVTTPYRGHKIWSGKDVHMIFISVTYIEGTPLFKGKGQVFLVLKPGFNLHSADTLALKTWLTTKKVDIFKCTLMTMMAAFTNWTISFTSIYCNIFFRLSFLNKKQFLPSKSKYLSKNKISIKITLFIDLC